MKSFIAILIVGILSSLSFIVSAQTDSQGSFTTTDYERFSVLSSDELYEKAAAYIQKDNVPDSALLCYTIILNRYDNGEIGDKDMSYVSGSLINLGFLYQDKYYDYSRAYDYLLRSLELAEKQGNDYDKPYIYLGMASVLQYVDSDGSSLPTPLHLVKKALSAAIDNNDPHTVAISAINLCDLAFERSDTSLIADEIKLTEAYLNKNNKSDKMLMPYLRAYHAVCKDDYNTALEALDEAAKIDFSDHSLSEKYRFFTAQQKYRVLRIGKRPAEAEQVLKELLKEAQNHNFQEFTLFALRELFALCRDEKRPEVSSQYEYRYLRMNDSINKTSNLLRVKDVVFANGIGHARREVTRLTTEKHLHLIIILAVSLITLLIATLLIYYIRTQRKLKDSNLALYNQIQELIHTRDEQTALRENTKSAGKESVVKQPD
ncbi:MAG: hypothetical protein K2H75_06275, partial [Muribaculaceae bacterium]|nr:hypothetical protein [Muribaculaceae bacterium]